MRIQIWCWFLLFSWSAWGDHHGNEFRQKLIKEYNQDYRTGLEMVYGPSTLSSVNDEVIAAWMEGHCLCGKNVLDIGSGLGGVDFQLGRRFSVKLTGIDINPELVKEASQRLKKEKGLKGDLHFRVAKNIASLEGFPDSSFDYVISKDTFYHIPNALKPHLLREVFRVLKPGGKILAVDWTNLTLSKGPFLQELDRSKRAIEVASPNEYFLWLRKAGFEGVNLEDQSRMYAQSGHANLDRLSSKQQLGRKFVARFGEQNRSGLAHGIGRVVQSLENHEISVTRIVGVKPGRPLVNPS